jgi:hypothetical protein
VTDDLTTPLGQSRPEKRSAALALVAPLFLAGALGGGLAVFAGWAMFADDPLGGEPVSVASVDLGADPGKKPDEPNASTESAKATARLVAAAVPPALPAAPPDGPPAGSKTITIIDGTSGKRQNVVVPGSGSSNASESDVTPIDARVSEPSPQGLLPKMAEDGTRPSEVFAQPVKPLPGKPDAPRIAIVVGGLGIGAKATADAIQKLPGAVTLAFGPYGGDVVRQVAQARGRGHELLLQVPMEPFDYPDNDPGPQTLLTSLEAGQNVNRLQWLMSRFQGYVGVANMMGARFTASEQALSPVLHEVAKRGLLYVDDGSSPRSLASQIAGADNLAFAKADVNLDQVATPVDVDRALGRLETTARERGVAVGVARALPVSIERIAAWAKKAASRGILLIPITAAVAKAKSS